MARKKGGNKRTSQGVTHPITTLAQGRLTLRTGRVTRQAAYAREALSELNDVESRACPVSTQFVPKIRSFRVHSDEFSIIRRVRWAPARRRGPHSSREVRGAVSRQRKTREIKPENLTNARSGSQKGVQQEDFPGVTHPITTLAQARLTLRTGRVTRRAAYAREALYELYDVENGARAVLTQFIPKIRPFRVHSGAFSTVRRVQWAPARHRGPNSSVEPSRESGKREKKSLKT